PREPDHRLGRGQRPAWIDDPGGSRASHELAAVTVREGDGGPRPTTVHREDVHTRSTRVRARYPLSASDGHSVAGASQPRWRGKRGRGDHLPLHRLPSLAHHVRLHGEVLGQAERIDDACRRGVPLLHALPELAVVLAREGGTILLALVLEDGEDLLAQLVLGHRSEEHTSELQSRENLV